MPVLLGGCDSDDRSTVTLYVSADEQVARKVIDAFEAKSNIRVLMVGDTEAKKTAGLVERLRAEKDKPQADVFWSSEIFMTLDLADEEMFAEHQSDATANWPKTFRDDRSRWFGFAARARVIVYSPDRVPEEAVPRTWMDLTNDRFRSRIVMADPRFGTTGGHLAVMKAYWDREVMPGYFGAFLEGLAANRIRLLPSGNAGVVEAVARGEADVGMTDTDDVWAAQAQGLKVRCVYPTHSVEPGETGIGTLLIPNTVALVKGAPHPLAASLLVDFLLSEQVERMLAESDSHNVPLRPELANAHPEYAVPDPLKIDYHAAAAMRGVAIRQAMKTLKERSPPTTQPAETQPTKVDPNDEMKNGDANAP